MEIPNKNYITEHMTLWRVLVIEIFRVYSKSYEHSDQKMLVSGLYK